MKNFWWDFFWYINITREKGIASEIAQFGGNHSKTVKYKRMVQYEDHVQRIVLQCRDNHLFKSCNFMLILVDNGRAVWISIP